MVRIVYGTKSPAIVAIMLTSGVFRMCQRGPGGSGGWKSPVGFGGKALVGPEAFLLMNAHILMFWTKN